VLFDERRGILLAGDHLLPHISSNPLITRPLSRARQPQADDDPDAPRPQALVQYIESMEATRELPSKLVLPGHGDPFFDHAQLIDERFRMHERRARKMLRLLAGGPLSAYELAHAMWGNIAVTQAYLTISEVLGHIDLLLRDGLARELKTDDGVIRFEAVR
jgi:glyoxylase-like metal-dependent hydrolase (beta-lactamase superfamily II)